MTGVLTNRARRRAILEYMRRRHAPSTAFTIIAIITLGHALINPAPAQNHSTGGSAVKRPGPARRFDAWKVIGPGGGGTMIGPTISPHDPKIVVEHCDMTGSYITTDGALSWRMFNLRNGISTFAFDPQDAKVIYAGNSALWRSEDTGKTWRMIFPDPAKNTREHTWSDHAEYVLDTDDSSYPASHREAEIQSIVVDPADSNRLYITMSGVLGTDQPASLYFSSDRGNTWSRMTEFGRERIYAIYIEHESEHERANSEPTLYVTGETGVYVYRGTRGSWQHLEGPASERIQFAGMGRAKGKAEPLLYVTTQTSWKGRSLFGGVYYSVDGGRSWRSASEDLMKSFYHPGEGEPPEFKAVACSLQDGAIAYLGFRGLRRGEGRENLYNGIARTTDGGAHWTIVHQESNHPSANMRKSWIEQRAEDSWPNIWFDAPYDLGVAPSNPDVCYATDLFRTYRTTDGGRTWEQVNSVHVSNDRWTTRGLDVTTSYGVHFDPFDARHILITYTDIGLFQSSDGGASWESSTVGIPNSWRNTTYWIAFDPQVESLLWGAFSGVHDLPRPKMWRNRNPDGYQGGVAISTDGGRHWTPSNSGMAASAVTHILLDPASPVGKRTLYACAFGRGVYKSTDNGKSWSLKNEGIEKQQPFAWRLTRANDGALYLIVARRSERGRIGDADDGALYKSIDGGERWTKMALPSGVNGPTGLALDPTDKRRMYLTAWGVARQAGDTGGGVYLSQDGGQTWKTIFDKSQHIYDLTIDAKHPRTLYICGFDSAAYRSTDGGALWTRIKGYNFKWGHRVILDSVDEKRIYITTFGGSVWHGPATGDPDAKEDIIQ